MLKAVPKGAEVSTATIGVAFFARHANLVLGKRGTLGNAVLTKPDDKALAELAAAERRVSEISTRIDRERQFIQQLVSAGNDVTSAEIVLDSLVLSLFLAAEDRHRLRKTLSMKAAVQGDGTRSVGSRRDAD